MADASREERQKAVARAADLKERLERAAEEDRVRRRFWTRLGFAGAVVFAVFLTRSLWKPRVGPEILLGARGDFSREHASLFRDVTLHRSADGMTRFLDEVPGALDMLRSYSKLEPRSLAYIVLDREIARRRWEGDPSGIGSIDLIAGLDARDYDLAHKKIRGRSYNSPDLDALLALDFDRARREFLAKPLNRQNLATLLQWGVPRAEVEAAVKNLPAEPEGFGSGLAISLADQLRMRLIIDDQTIADPSAELRKRGFPVPRRRYLPPRWYPRRASRPAPFPPGQRLTLRNADWAREALMSNPRDSEALVFLRREAALPLYAFRTEARRALVGAGDKETIVAVATDFSSPLGTAVVAAVDSCEGSEGARLLASPVVREHRWPWVRIRAVVRLREMEPSDSRAALAVYRTNSCRDARLIASGKTPYAISRGMLQNIGCELEGPGSEAGYVN